MKFFTYLFFFIHLLTISAVYSQNRTYPANIRKIPLKINRMPDTASCIKYLNTLPVLKTTQKGKEFIAPGVYRGFAQRYDSLAGSYLDGVAFYSRVTPGAKDSVQVKVRAYSVNPMNGTNLILGTTYTYVTLDTTLPLRKVAFFDSSIFIQGKVIISLEATSPSTDNLFVERNSAPDGKQQNLSLVNQNGQWWPNLISNLGPEYDFDFLILPIVKKIHSGFQYTLDSTGALITQNLCRGDTSSFLWDFGDGKTATGSAPSHTYTYNCTFPLKLTAYNADKTCMDSSQKSVFVWGFPCNINAGFTYQVDTINKKILFQNTSISSCSYESIWYLNDTIFSKTKSPELNIPKTKKFKIKLEIETNACVDSTSDTIVITTQNSFIKEEIKKKIIITVNPTVFNEFFELTPEADIRINVYNSQGQIVDYRTLMHGKKERVNTLNWSAGLYLLKGTDAYFNKKIMKMD